MSNRTSRPPRQPYGGNIGLSTSSSMSSISSYSARPKRQPYGGNIGLSTSSSMHFSPSASTNAALAAASVATMPRSQSMSLSSAAAAAALKHDQINAAQAGRSVLVPSKRAQKSAALSRRPSLSERNLRAPSSSGGRMSLRMSSAPSVSGRSNSIRSTLSLPRAFKRSGYASSIASYESTDLNSISEDRMLDSVAASPKMMPPPVIDEEPRETARSLTASKLGVKQSRSSSRMSQSSTLSVVDTEDGSLSRTGTPSAKRNHRVSFTDASVIDDIPAPASPKFVDGVDEPTAAETFPTATDMENTVSVASTMDEMKTPPETMSPEPSLNGTSTLGGDESAPTTFPTESATTERVIDDDVNAPAALTEDIGDYDPNIIADILAARAIEDDETELDRQYLSEHESEFEDAAPVQQEAKSVPRKAVGSAPSEQPTRVITPPAEVDARERSQNQQLLHPTPRNAKPSNGILKGSPERVSSVSRNSRYSRAPRPATTYVTTAPTMQTSVSSAAIAAAASASHQPSAEEIADLENLRERSGSASSFRREDGVSRAASKSRGSMMKTSMRDVQVPSMRNGRDARGFGRPVKSQKQLYREQLEEAKSDPRVMEQLHPTTAEDITETAYVGLQRVNSSSSYKKESTSVYRKEQPRHEPVAETTVSETKGRDEKGRSFGLKRFTLTPRKSRVVSNPETSSAAPLPPPPTPAAPVMNGYTNGDVTSTTAAAAEPSSTGTTATPPATIATRGFSQLPSSHPFSLDSDDVFTATPTVSNTAANDSSVGVAYSSFDTSPAKSDRDRESALAKLTGSASASSTTQHQQPQQPQTSSEYIQQPVTPVKQKKLSQYQQFRLERAQKKEQKNGKRATTTVAGVPPPLPNSNAQTAAAAAAMSGRTTSVQPTTAPAASYDDSVPAQYNEKTKSKKFGGLRKLFKLDD